MTGRISDGAHGVHDTPPRKPRRARWWVCSAVVVVVTYVSCYAALRLHGDLEVRLFYVNPTHRPLYLISAPAPPWQIPTRWRTFFRPCIKVEEWWRNRESAGR